MSSQIIRWLGAAISLQLISGAFAFADDQAAAGPPTGGGSPLQLDWPGGHLFGSWLGLRTQLEKAGVKPTLTLVTDFAWNPVGGRSQGATQASNIGLDLLFDLDKIAGIRDGSFLFQVSERFGSSLSQEYIGNVFSTQQIYGGGETFRVVDIAYQQKWLDGRVEFRLGRLTTGDDFLFSPYDYLFMQNGICGNPVGIFFDTAGMTIYPIATWGAMLKVKPSTRSYVMFGVYDGDPGNRDNNDHGLDPSLDGPVFAIGEVGTKINGLPGDEGPIGNYKVGIWYDDSDFTEFRSGTTTRGSLGLYGLFDQVLIPFGGAGRDRGLGVFGGAMFATNARVAQIPFVFNAGLVATGIFGSRTADTCGVGIVFGNFSGDVRDAEREGQNFGPRNGVQDYELAIELTNRFYFTDRALYLQPDLQYIVHPGGSSDVDNALILAIQVGINF